MRGEFICANGLVVPNNITSFGAMTLLSAAVRNVEPTFFVGLVEATPAPEVLIAATIEPSFANGYERKPVTRDFAGWPSAGYLNGEPWFETGWLTWTATGDFDKPIRRLMLVQKAVNVANDLSEANLKVMALSSALPSDLVITLATPEADRKFKYRIYAR